MSTLSFLVIGQGSIGQRHARLLSEYGSVSTVSEAAPGAYRSVEAAFARHSFDHVVIANVTSAHTRSLQALADEGFGGTCLTEKPICGSLDELVALEAATARIGRVVVGYNLRFHPVVQSLRQQIGDAHIYEARLNVGQRLSDWRPGTDHRLGSSSLVAAGGGALRDLSHEIDLALHLFGPWKRLVAWGGNFGSLGIETDEAWSIIMEMITGAMVTISLNYFDRPAQRRISTTTSKGSFLADLVGNEISHDGASETFYVERDDTYRAMHKAFMALSPPLCTFEDGIAVMHVIDAVGRSAREQRWIEK